MFTSVVARAYRAGQLLGLLTLLAAAGRTAAAAEPATARVPLRKVVLFNSGVGFFRHEGEVIGDQTVELKFNVDDVNDLLKSMVLEDLGGGRISAVTYSAREPITRTLKTFAIDLTHNPTLADLLRQVRGEKIQVDAPNPITGTIVGLERRHVRSGKDDSAEIDVLDLLTATGLRSIPLDNIQQTQLLDPALNAELQQALAILAQAHRGDKKSVTLEFLGKGQRAVRIGYIQEFPVWKTSYRLVVKDDGSLFLQGWAIVENTTEQDWNKVAMTLVSGRPISFVQDLYQPLYVDRPVVVPELYASLTPRVYEQDLASAEQDFRNAANGEGQIVRRRMNPFQSGGGLGGNASLNSGMGGMGGGGFGGGGFGNAAGKNRRPNNTSVVPAAGGDAGAAKPDGAQPLDLSHGVASVAQADEVGELFRYVIESPVTLARQKSAMLPIVNDKVKGEKLSIYNPDVHPKHPLNGLKLINSTGLHLMQGPITVFDGGEYAGDARIDDLQPGTQRLLSYALDLDTEVAPEPERSTESLAAVQITGAFKALPSSPFSDNSRPIIQNCDASLSETHVIVRTRPYVVKNSGPKTKKVLIEYPLDPQWTLVSPKEPAEKTRDLGRFAIQAEPGKRAVLEISEQHIEHPETAIPKFDDNPGRFFTRARPEQIIDSLAGVKIGKGMLTETRLLVRTRQFVVRNSGAKGTKLPIDYAAEPLWTLVSPKEAEKSRGFYHFQVPADPTEPAILEIVERRTISPEQVLSNLDDARTTIYLAAASVSPAVKAALTEIGKRKQALAALVVRKNELEGQLAEVNEEQSRIRQNMSQLDRNSELYNRYVKKFGVQEDTVEKLRQQFRDLSGELEAQRKALEEYLAKLTAT